jgi:antitoxin ParD1/3/4
MAGRNFSLTAHLSEFVTEQAASGRHQNASEVVREALRRYEEDVEAERASLKVLERVAARGLSDIAEGRYTLVSGPEDARKLMAQFDARAAARAAKRRQPKKARRG